MTAYGGRGEWFREARFGLFIHWGIYALPAGEWEGRGSTFLGEWLMASERIPIAQYERLAPRFNPAQFDADAWVRTARLAGMRYVVITAKHHDGFAMYGSSVDQWNIVDATPFGRDPLRELADACAQQGMPLGVYYSQSLDWHEPDAGGTEPGLPTNFGASWGNDWDFPDHGPKDFARYFERKVKPQLREILTGYGPIALLWFDCPFTITPEQSSELAALVHELQPDCLVNTRLGNGLGDIASFGDNQTPEAPVCGLHDTPATTNDTWGYKRYDLAWKRPADIVATLATLTARGTNYLLNVGPNAEGLFPEGALNLLRDIAAWSADSGDAIAGAGPGPFPTDMPWGVITARPGTLFLHLLHPPEGAVEIHGLRNRVLGVECAIDGLRLPLPFAERHATECDNHLLTIAAPPPRADGAHSVIAVTIDGPADVPSLPGSQAGGIVDLPAALAEIRPTPTCHPALDAAGIIGGWRQPGPVAAWRFAAARPGAHKITIVTSALHHGAPWRPGGRVRARIGESVTEGDLRGETPIETPGTRCYAQSRSTCGTIRIEAAGDQELCVEALSIPGGPAGFALVSVRLQPDPSGGD